MNRIILNKEVKVEADKAIITEKIETTLDRNQLESKLRDISMRKTYIVNQNKMLINEFNNLIDEEEELKNLISQLDMNEIEVIGDV